MRYKNKQFYLFQEKYLTTSFSSATIQPSIQYEPETFEVEITPENVRTESPES
jgi:hypothetical protein